MPPRPTSRSSSYLPAITGACYRPTPATPTGETGCAAPSAMGQAGADQHRHGRQTGVPRSHTPRRPRVARTHRALDGPRRPARGAVAGEREVLRRLRPHRTQPPHGAPGPGADRAPTPARRPPALRAGGWRHRHDRRPEGLRGAHPQLPRRRQGLGRPGARPDRAVPGLRRPQRRDHGQQLRLDREPLDDRLPARRRQALPGQPDAGARRRQPAPRAGHQLHRVQLRAAAVLGLPQPPPRPRRHPAVRRLRPVGQPHGRRGADPPGRRRPGPRVRDAAAHQVRRHQVRQDRGRGALARPGDALAVRLPPVLAERRGRQGGRAAPGLHLPRPRADRGARGARPARSRGCAPARSCWPTR